MFLYCFITWLLANLLHPFVMLIVFQSENYLISGEGLGFVIMIFLYILLFSIPSLLMGFLVLHLISLMNIADGIKYFIWLGAALLIILVNLFLIYLLFESTKMITLSDFEIGIPAMIAVTIANLVRVKYFFKDIQQLKTKRESYK